jgi:hypothetical protein
VVEAAAPALALLRERVGERVVLCADPRRARGDYEVAAS